MNLKNNRYKVLKNFNENVYLAQDESTMCLYILKKCSSHQNERYKHQFRVEIDVLSKLNSAYVPSLVDVFIENEDTYLVQTYIDGFNLKEYMQQRKFLLFKFRILFSMIQILNEIHKIGYLYIDLKPENVIVFQHHYYLIDFNACIEKNSRIAIMASKSNCAPELLSYEKKDEASDVYALGSFIKALYPYTMKILVFLCHRSKHKRIQSLKTIKLFIYLRYCFYILLLIILSVFFVNQSFGKKSVFDVYYQNHTISLFQKAYNSTAKKERLYTWISNDWILDEVYEDEQSGVFLMKEAIETKDASMVQFVYQKVDLHKYPEIQAQALMYMHPSTKTINTCIHSTLKSSYLLKEKIRILDQCIVNAIDNEYLIDIKSIQDWLYKQKMTTQFEDLGCDYLEYLFLVKKEEDKMYEIPESFIEQFNSPRWNKLYEFWRTLT